MTSLDASLNAIQLRSHPGLNYLLDVVAALRHPETGCPWDLKQTHSSLRPYLLEEAYEAVEAISALEQSTTAEALGDFRDELGDVLLQVALHAQLASEAGTFTFDAIAQSLADKLVRRHPHVFSTASVDTADGVVQQWDAIKQDEKWARSGGTESPAYESILKGVKKSQPALSRALETSQKAVKVGFEWPDTASLWACVMSEFDEFKQEADLLAINPEDSAIQDRLELEMGDILFASVNLARQYGINPEIALTRATEKFTKRFQRMEAIIADKHAAELDALTPVDLKAAMKTLDFENWDALWVRAKQGDASA